MKKFDIKNKQQNMFIINLEKAVKELPDFHYVRTSSPSKLIIQAGHYFGICVNKILFGKSKNKKENKND